MSRLICTLSIVVIVVNTVLGQLYQDASGFAVTVHSQSELKNLPAGSPLAGRKFSFNTYDLWVPLPYFEVGKTEFFTTVNYRLLDVDYEESTSLDPNRPERVHEVKAMVFAKMPVKKSWSILVLGMPSLASDFRGSLSADDVIVQGALALIKKINSQSKLEVGLGVFATYVFGDLLFIPAFTIDFESHNKKWIGQAYWPRFNLFYNVSPKFQVGMAVSIDGTEYNLKEYYDLQGALIDHAEFSVVHAGLQVNRRVYRNFWFQLQGGMAVGNAYKLFDNRNREIPNGDYSLKDMGYGKVMLTYRFDLAEE